jgi:2-polyprenyl-3-methyl-5-hydroxy-6-metoxy-1,4-benzoquinol methylase
MMKTTDQTAETKEAFEQPEWYLESRRFNIRLRCETVQAFVQGCEFVDVLDIGCGNGMMTIPLLNARRRITFLDLSASMLKIARANVPVEFLSQIETINTDFLAAHVEERSYDFINCLGVLAYVEDLEAFLSKLKASLRPGGLLLLECTDAPHFVSALTRVYDKIRRSFTRAVVPLVDHSSESILREMNRLGFELCHSYRYSLPLPGIKNFFSQNGRYKLVRAFFGPSSRNRNKWLGNECIYCLRLTKKN